MSFYHIVILITLFGEPHALPVYIMVADFTKLAWVFATYFTYSFFPLTH